MILSRVSNVEPSEINSHAWHWNNENKKMKATLSTIWGNADITAGKGQLSLHDTGRIYLTGELICRYPYISPHTFQILPAIRSGSRYRYLRADIPLSWKMIIKSPIQKFTTSRRSFLNLRSVQYNTVGVDVLFSHVYPDCFIYNMFVNLYLRYIFRSKKVLYIGNTSPVGVCSHGHR